MIVAYFGLEFLRTRSVQRFEGWNKDPIQMFIFDGDGFAMLYKRLDNGKIQWSKNENEVRNLSQQEIRWPLGGLSIIEHAYEFTSSCKSESTHRLNKPAIQRSIANPSALAKVIHDKFALYLPLYRQVNEWERYEVIINDKHLSNRVIRAA
ncbi:IS66 family insertion sequence element accessory protein TnpB [Bacillus sp. A301a_S52]|nr:IS66 family insertion sequence element accessory protein TnpB [Bacillus sp. A301a_S52]